MIILGEKINTIREKIASAIQQRNAEVIQREAVNQVKAGIDVLDVNVGSPIGEEENMRWAVEVIQKVVDVPLCIDSSNPKVIEAGFQVCENKRKAWINSMTLQKEKIETLLPLAKTYKCPLIALCMDDNGGVPSDPKKRVRIAEKIIDKVSEAGISLKNLYIDCLIEPISLGPGKVQTTLDTIRMIKKIFRRVKTVVCLSAVSFGLPGRSLINRTFLSLLVITGVDAIFLDPLDKSVMSTLRALDVLLDKDKNCLRYIKAYRERKLKI